METPWVRPVCNVLQRMTLGLFANYEVVGKENVPPMGPLIIVANHQSNFDPPLLGASIPRRTWFLAKDGIFRGSVPNWFLRSYGAFPLNRTGPDVRAYRWVLNRLNEDKAVIIFPEGTRSDGAMQRAMPGIVQLALKAQVPLLPVGITGTERIRHWMRVVNPTGRIRVNIGTVFSIPHIEGRPNREVLQSLADMIMGRIAALLPERYQGVYRIGTDPGAESPTPGPEGIEKIRVPRA